MPRDYPELPVVGVGAIIWRGDQVLLVRRGNPPRAGQWSLPGGRQELGETVVEAAKREVTEETGLTVEIAEVVTVVDLIERDDDGRVRYHYVLIDVNAEWVAGEPLAADDAADARWIGLDALDDVELWIETRRVIRLAAERRAANAPGAAASPTAHQPPAE